MNPLELAFPTLASGYRITSPTTSDYNCIAWAAGETDRWWWPDTAGVAYWPSTAPREETIAAFQKAFSTLGYEIASDRQHVSGSEKVALMAKAGKPTHMCRQLPNGRWTSKLGQSEDIEHELDALVGLIYGDVHCILQRPITSPLAP
jgi:hypothetical protein